MENHSTMTGWQELFSHTNPSNFGQPKIYRLPNFKMLIQFLPKEFSKSKVLLCLQKVDHVIIFYKQKAYF